MGRVTNALGWVASTPPSWLPEVATPDQVERYVRPVVRGEREECYAITEEGAGSDVDAIEATARRETTGEGEPGGYVLNGVKWHVTSYNTADFAFFQAKLDGGPHHGEHAMFLVDLPSPGVRVVRTPAYSHTISHHHPIVEFADVRVPAANLVGAEGDGMSFAYEWFRFERLMVAARCLGAADRLVAEMTTFAEERTVGGRPISEYGLVGGMLADSMTELFAARSLTYETARNIDRSTQPSPHGFQPSPHGRRVDLSGPASRVAHAQCSMAKLYCSEMAGRVADRAVQVFGGRGYMRENVAERFYRELRVERIWEGTSEIQRAIIARQMVKRGPQTLA
jgi:alkylation response protein AidB-like acyl-CoA dehydrogenase